MEKGARDEVVVSAVAHGLEAHREHIERGALLSIDEEAARVRVAASPPIEGVP